MENNIAPLDNDTITRLVYAHDDELTEAIRQIRVLMDRVKELEEIKKQSKGSHRALSGKKITA